MKSKFILFIACLALLLTLQAKVIVPLVYKVAASSFFLEDSGDEGSRISSTSIMTEAAFTQCNSYIANEELPDDSISFSKKAINSFGLGDFRYLINADITIQPNDSAAISRRYVCRIQYKNGADTAGLSDPENWSVDGISGIDGTGDF